MFFDKELIIFDMDGTLIDSAPSLAFAVNKTLKELGLKEYSLEKIRKWIGNGAEVLIKRSLVGDFNYQNYQIDNMLFIKAKKIFLEIYGANLTTNAKLYDGVADTLKVLNKNYTLTVATNKPQEFVASMLRDFKIDSYFTITMGAQENIPKKPNPQMLLTIAKELNIATQNSVMVGDSKNDLLAANAANIDTIALSYGYHQGVNLKQFNPKVICDNFSDITNYFKT